MSMTALLLTLIVILLATLYIFFHRRFNYWRRLGIAHDKPSWLLGNLVGAQRTLSFADISRNVYLKYKGTGPFCGFYFFQCPAVVLLDIELIKNVLIRDFANFADRGMFNNERDDPLSGHLFLLDGHKWRSLRTKLSSTFTSGKMKLMLPMMIEVTQNLVEVMGEQLLEDNVVELKEILARYTTDIIGKVAFGIVCNSLRDSEAEFRIMGRRSFSESRHGQVVGGLMHSFPDLARWLRMRAINDDVIEFFMRIVRETVEYREKNNIKCNDFMSLLIDLRNDKKLRGDNGEEKCLTIEEMAAQTFVFFIAGFETSSTTMAFALYELAQKPSLQERLRREVLGTIAKHNNEFTFECLQDMKYMDQVVLETLRKYSVVPILNRKALSDYAVPGHPNFVIKKGMSVIIPTVGIHYDPNIYPNPEQWDPERFTQEQRDQRESVEWLPFGDGPRNCIGKRFGGMQIRVGLAHLLCKYRFSVCDKTEIPLKMNVKSFLISTLNGIYLRVEEVK
ncbi:PREDICTED: cytochrome P450 6a9-like [Rhagoletis zephyria]|uniref:cytochrome P450 6a9-like n=1 Tax=Rhagoletis zephyria TaxID=28612 RepID=UPI0008113B4A|nr:PREDICTED: cytochrome P450 6a9-like [Rhagoletis zephyria]